MLRHNRSLLVLFLHWNKICAKGGAAIAKALRDNSTLQVFDFSYNNVGSTKEHECAKAFAACFESNTSLLHVDMSSDLFDREDVQILNQGLTENHSILGIHMGGNKGRTDPLGFVNPLAENDEAESHVFTRIQPNLQVGTLKSKKMRQLRAFSNCWICEGWAEVRFEWRSG